MIIIIIQRLFWEQQLEVASKKDKRGLRWHPLMIRWCLYIRYRSSGAYEALRESGILALPSQRTLRDYTHYTNGFANLGDVNKHLDEFEQVLTSASDSETPTTTTGLAKTVMVFMVRGLFNKLQFPYAQFPCTKLQGDLLFEPFWEVVRRIEMCGLKVTLIIIIQFRYACTCMYMHAYYPS